MKGKSQVLRLFAFLEENSINLTMSLNVMQTKIPKVQRKADGNIHNYSSKKWMLRLREKNYKVKPKA